MLEDTDMELREICCTCLSVDRKLTQLCKINDGINNLYFLLSYDPEAYKEGFFKDLTSLFICWECCALIRRMVRFRLQACDAQKYLSSPQQKHHKCLSRLATYHKATLDKNIISIQGYYSSSSLDTDDNFVDCNTVDVKSEVDESDDVPLSILQTSTVLCDKEEKSSDSLSQDIKEELTTVISTLDTCSNYKKVNSNEKPNKRKTKMKNIQNFETIPKAALRLCHKSLKNKEMLINDKTAQGYQCAECDKCFRNKNLRWKHVQRSHREGFRCHTCGKRYAFKHTLNRHPKSHTTPSPREECQVCHKMIRVDLAKVHAEIHSKRERFSCAACNKTFVSRASYQHHLKYTQTHSTIKILKYKCSTCDKAYRSRGELRDHENYQHGKGSPLHHCPVCGKALATKRCVTRHVRRAHDGIKESARDKICQQCGKAFRDKKGLREHEFIHTGERPLSCSECGRTFRQNASLYTHRKRVHNIHPSGKGSM